jgi:hypothetical protein
MIAYLSFVMPFVSFSLNIQAILMEVLLIVIVLLMSSMFPQITDDFTAKKEIGWVVIYMVGAIALLSCVFVVIDIRFSVKYSRIDTDTIKLEIEKLHLKEDGSPNKAAKEETHGPGSADASQ